MAKGHRPPNNVDATIHGEMDRISQALTQRVKELAERYETPMPQQVRTVAELEAKVNRHLPKMGFSLLNGELKMENGK